jgi:dephospho-CoA kinase
MTATSTPLRIGLTGGIGSGKSTVGQMLQARGATVIDADAIARSVTAPGGAAMPAIASTFGTQFIDARGALDRERMRAHVFAHAPAKHMLEAIIHPLVAKETQQQVDLAIAAGAHVLVFDVPLLIESGRWRAQVDRVLVVDCLQETQIQRVMARSQLSRESVQAIIAAQATRAARVSAADWVIYNEGLSIDVLRQQVDALPMAPHLKGMKPLS